MKNFIKGVLVLPLIIFMTCASIFPMLTVSHLKYDFTWAIVAETVYIMISIGIVFFIEGRKK